MNPVPSTITKTDSTVVNRHTTIQDLLQSYLEIERDLQAHGHRSAILFTRTKLPLPQGILGRQAKLRFRGRQCLHFLNGAGFRDQAFDERLAVDQFLNKLDGMDGRDPLGGHRRIYLRTDRSLLGSQADRAGEKKSERQAKQAEAPSGELVGDGGGHEISGRRR